MSDNSAAAQATRETTSILARVPKARRAGHLKVVVTGGSDKCGYKRSFCAPNGEKGHNCGGG